MNTVLVVQLQHRKRKEVRGTYSSPRIADLPPRAPTCVAPRTASDHGQFQSEPSPLDTM